MITTMQAIQLLAIVNKMEIKDNVIEAFKNTAPIEERKKVILKEMLEKSDYKDAEITEEVTDDLFKEFPELAKEYKDLEDKVNSLAGDVIMTILLAIPKAENEFYKLIGDIKGIETSEAKQLPIDETAKIIVDFMSDGELMGFLNSIMK